MPGFFKLIDLSVFGVFSVMVFSGCETKPIEQTMDIVQIDMSRVESAVESAFGKLERDKSGTIVGVDLAHGRASATDDVLEKALSLPKLKRFRLAGGDISRETFLKLSGQVELEDLFLQDVPVSDDDLVAVLSSLPKLKRVSLRRLPNVSDRTIVETTTVSYWENLALIDMNITVDSVRKIAEQKKIRALDLRNCNRLLPGDLSVLIDLTMLVDLKIGGFSVDDTTLETITPITGLVGLTIEDTFITPEGWKRFVEKSQSVGSLETLVLNRCSSLLDDSLSVLSNLPKLKRLTVGDMMVTGSFLKSLAEEESKRPKLQRLSLRKTLLTNEGVEVLKKYPELRFLDLSGTAMTVEIAKALETLHFVDEIDVTGCQPDPEARNYLRELKNVKNLDDR